MTLQRLVLPTILKADDVIGKHRLLRIDSRRRCRLRSDSCVTQTHECRIYTGDQVGQARHWCCVGLDVRRDDFSCKFKEISGSRLAVFVRQDCLHCFASGFLFGNHSSRKKSIDAPRRCGLPEHGLRLQAPVSLGVLADHLRLNRGPRGRHVLGACHHRDRERLRRTGPGWPRHEGGELNGLEVRQVGFDCLHDREGRGIRSFGYGNVYSAASVHECVAGLDVGAVFDRSDVAYENRLRSLRADRNVVEAFDIADNGVDRYRRP